MRRSRIRLILDRKWLMPLTLTSIFSLIYFLSLQNPTSYAQPDPDFSPNLKTRPEFPSLPKFAYMISGTKGDVSRITRVLKSVYHPRNYYVLHLDLEASDSERTELANIVRSEGVFRTMGNVMVVGKADLVTYKGPTMIACTLHAVAVLLKLANDWDWFVNLSAMDYPLVSQDDLLHIFSYLPRDLNFLEHTSDFGWKENQRARPLIIDPGLYHSKKSSVFYAKEKRSMPVSFKLFTGSAWVVMAKPFLEFCVWGWDNLPRTLLMYYTNFLSSSEGYFHTVVCNHKSYQNTTVNHDLRYIKWDNPPRQHPMTLTSEHFNDMVQSGAPFAHKFAMDDPVLKKIDEQILKRSEGGFTPGGWCVGSGIDPCAFFGSPNVIKPGASSKRLEKLLVHLLDFENFRPNQCI